MVYLFLTTLGKKLFTKYAPIAIASFFCFDATTEDGESFVILQEDVDFTSFDLAY